ncbi:hypothetical protein HU200_010160 [Digitaria exilis]|uniref:ATP synthase subunit alpha n=1 Tax=Digitaria exilis TaxID=1010633 RepID=A0A835KRX9_9POAL|nr:hypothetical protein HU200_010160 [Digitaria exilis]
MATLRVDEINKILRERIEQYNRKVGIENIGRVVQVGDGIARIIGLGEIMSGELVEFAEGTRGIALNLESKNVGIVLMGDGLMIQEGSFVKATGRIAQIPVSEAYLGRVINALAKPIDGRGEIAASESRLIESPAPGIISRRSVYEPLQTGLIAIDSMIPIGRGQRELIIGDRQTGKTAVATDTILNQKGQDVICVYVAIGQKKKVALARCRSAVPSQPLIELELQCELARFLVMEPAHQGSSPRLGTGARIFLDLFQDLTGAILSVVGNVPVGSEAPVVTSSIWRICRPSLSEVLIGVGLRAYVCRGKCAFVYMSVCVCTV